MSAADGALDIFAAAREAPDAIGLIASGQPYSYRALAERARAAMEHLPPPPDAAPLVAEASVDTVAALHALLARGQPALLLHARATDDERAATLSRYRAATATAPPPSLDIAARDPAPLASPITVPPLPPATPDALLAVGFTSGSTGEPRGVLLGREGFLAAAAASAANLGWREDDRWLCALPLAHVGGLSVLLRCLVARRCAVLHAGSFDAGEVIALVADARVTLASLVPTMLARLVEREPPWRVPPHLRAILLGGAAAPRPLLARAAALGVPFLTSYGMTETWGQVCTQSYALRGQLRDGVGSLLPGVAVDASGPRLRLRAPMQMLGYLGEPPLPAGAWLTTGDTGHLDADGVLHVHGRADDVIITGGENVHPLEVEAALAACAGIRAACVFAVPDPRWGQLVAAAVVLAPPDEPDEALAPSDAPDDARPDLDDTALDRPALAAALASRLAPFKRPRLLCVLPALPLGPSGKVDRAATARLAAAQLAPL